MIRRILALIFAASAPPAAGADLYVSGNQAHDICQRDPAWCLGFVTGALDGWAALEHYYPGEKFCVPEGTTAGRLKELFIEELNVNAAGRDSPAAYMLYERLIRDFPCA